MNAGREHSLALLSLLEDIVQRHLERSLKGYRSGRRLAPLFAFSWFEEAPALVATHNDFKASHGQAPFKLALKRVGFLLFSRPTGRVHRQDVRDHYGVVSFLSFFVRLVFFVWAVVSA